MERGPAALAELANRARACDACLAGAPVDQELALEPARLAADLRVIPEGGAARPDGGGQDRAKPRRQSLGTAGADGAGAPARADPGPEQGLAGVDVPDPRDDALIEQRRLDRGRPPAEDRAQLGTGDVERLGPQLPQPRMCGVRAAGEQVDETEPPRIAERQPKLRAVSVAGAARPPGARARLGIGRARAPGGRAAPATDTAAAPPRSVPTSRDGTGPRARPPGR